MVNAEGNKALDALILAGTGGAYVPVGNRAKAIIRLKGRRLVEYVIEAMDSCAHVRSITVIGPMRRLSFLRKIPALSKPLELIPQHENLVRNVLAGYDHIRPGHGAPILVATADIPLLSPGEISHFITHSGYEDYDYVINAAMDGVFWYFCPELRIVHLPPDSTGSQAGDKLGKLVADIRRFIYMREKFRYHRRHFPDEAVDPGDPIHEYAAMLAKMDQEQTVPYRPWDSYEVGQCIHHLAWEDCGVVVAKEKLPGGRQVIKCYFEEAGVVRLIEQAPR